MPGFETINPQTPNERRKMLSSFTPAPEKNMAEEIEDENITETPVEKLNVTSLAEGAAEGQQEIAKGLAKFEQWEEKMEKAEPDKLKEFVKFCEKGQEKDPLVEKYPDLKTNYQELKRKAIALLEEQGLDIIINNLKEAAKKPAIDKAEDIETAIYDLDASIKTWQKKAEDPQTLKADQEKLKRLVFDAKQIQAAQMQ
ncbi:MAG TPA: hypothetical protein ENN28_02595 [Candidatus Uhrbacteria bacterium]|nr:hypothetical protein [Candidatus Uhrbacteria bacterium]